MVYISVSVNLLIENDENFSFTKFHEQLVALQNAKNVSYLLLPADFAIQRVSKFNIV